MIEYDEFGPARLFFAVREDKLIFVSGCECGEKELQDWLAKHFPAEQTVRVELPVFREWLRAYFAGEKVGIPPYGLTGTAFQKQVWEALFEVHRGETISYTALAEKIGKKSAVRAVASAVGKNPLLIVCPCHRIIGKNGTLHGYRGGLAMKKRLLELEQSN
ncbi:methylated-DNA--[protein]-cysteine S-methyltransferase [Listeria costaricensis]|uniref:methylated-DNA--[protein]-cysteine S-methyltransferase n=1 Tax=Listeria costaricensis TaxID=2026604 RepID=UPI0023E2C5DA|nr:methylated-DNA--[protein]-cysteine S-methyltransferase [Listeria costaricensis]